MSSAPRVRRAPRPFPAPSQPHGPGFQGGRTPDPAARPFRNPLPAGLAPPSAPPPCPASSVDRLPGPLSGRPGPVIRPRSGSDPSSSFRGRRRPLPCSPGGRSRAARWAGPEPPPSRFSGRDGRGRRSRCQSAGKAGPAGGGGAEDRLGPGAGRRRRRGRGRGRGRLRAL